MDENEKSVQGLLFGIVHSYLAKSFGRISHTGIHPRQMPMLRLLEKRDGVSQSELCKMLGIKPSTVTVSLKRMEKMGLVQREQDARDQRVIRVFLTEKAKNIVQETREILEEYEQITLQGLSEAEICLLRRMLEQVWRNVQKIPMEDGCIGKMLDGEENQE